MSPGLHLWGAVAARRGQLVRRSFHRLTRFPAKHLQSSPCVAHVHRVAPSHPRIPGHRDGTLDGLQVGDGAVAVTKREVVEREIDVRVREDLRIADLTPQNGTALVVLEGLLDTTELGKAPARGC
jgi:hypothetical protein